VQSFAWTPFYALKSYTNALGGTFVNDCSANAGQSLTRSAQACGGEISAGPLADGGWQVHARLPHEPSTTRSAPLASSRRRNGRSAHASAGGAARATGLSGALPPLAVGGAVSHAAGSAGSLSR
jgi:hypothetical protein